MNTISNHLDARPIRIAAYCLFLFSILSIAGWVFSLNVIHPLWVVVNPLTSLCFIFTGIALMMIFSSKLSEKYSLFGISLLPILVGGSKVISLCFNIPFPAEMIFYKGEINMDGVFYPFPKVAVNTAINLFIAGITITLLSRFNKKNILSIQYLSLLILVNCSLAVISYLYGLKNFLIFKMAFSTAMVFIILSLSILLSTKNSGFMKIFFSHYLGSKTARTLLPFSTIVPIILGAIALKAIKYGMPSEFAIAILVLLYIIVLTVLITQNSKQLNKIDIIRRKAEYELDLKNELLSRHIAELIRKDKTIEKIQEFKFLSDSVPQIIWTSKPDGSLDYYNSHWYDYTGLTVEETLGWGWKPVLHPEDLAMLLS